MINLLTQYSSDGYKRKKCHVYTCTQIPMDLPRDLSRRTSIDGHPSAKNTKGQCKQTQ